MSDIPAQTFPAALCISCKSARTEGTKRMEAEQNSEQSLLPRNKTDAELWSSQKSLVPPSFENTFLLPKTLPLPFPQARIQIQRASAIPHNGNQTVPDYRSKSETDNRFCCAGWSPSYPHPSEFYYKRYCTSSLSVSHRFRSYFYDIIQ